MNIASLPITINIGNKKLLKIILVLQLAVLGAVGLDCVGIKIPILRQILCFIYLSIIPGILILRSLKVRNLSISETILYATGLSVSFLMFTGALMNSLYPLVGIQKPISEISLVITISAVVLSLCFICYLRNKNYSNFSINREQIFAPFVLSLLLLPFLAVFGAYLFNFYDNNILLLVLLVIICIIFLFGVFNNIQREIYPLALWSISISLLLHNSLLSILGGGDSEIEYYFSELVKLKSLWDPSIPSEQNAMLSIVILKPIFSSFCNIEMTWVFKVLYPLLFSLTPIGLYLIYKKQMNDRMAFLSCFIFMAASPFYTVLSRNTRTGTAIFFMTLLILLLINGDKIGNKLIERLLFLVFTISLIVSHYATSYLYIFSLIFLLIFSSIKRKKENMLLNLNYFILTLVFALIWYIYTTSSFTFTQLIRFFYFVFSQISQEFLSPEMSFTLALTVRSWSLSIEVVKYFFYIYSFFIAVGLLSWGLSLSKKSSNYGVNVSFNFSYEYFSLALAFFGMTLSTILPIRPFNTTRVYQISLIFTAPFLLHGLLSIFSVFKRGIAVISSYSFNLKDETILKVFSFSLVIFFLFSSGFFSETVIRGNDYSPSILIHKRRISEIADPQYKASFFYSKYMYESDVVSARWLSKNRDAKSEVWIDYLAYGTIASYGMMGPPHLPPTYNYLSSDGDVERIKLHSYIRLTYFNYVERVAQHPRKGLDEPPNIYNPSSLIRYMESHFNKIYDDGGVIYYR